MSGLNNSVLGGGGVTGLANTVQPEIVFNLSPAAGVSTEASRGDHTHGTPPAPASQITAEPNNSNPNFDASFQFDPTVATVIPNDAEGSEGYKSSRENADVTYQRMSPSFNNAAVNNGRWTKITNAGKLMISSWLENLATKEKNGAQQFLQFDVQTNFTGTLRMGLLQNTGAADTLPSPIVSAWNGAGVDPTLGAGLSYIAALSAGVTSGVPGTFGITSTPGNISNLALAIWSNDVMAVNDRIELSNVRFTTNNAFGLKDSNKYSKIYDEIMRFYEKSYENDVPPGTALATAGQASVVAPAAVARLYIPSKAQKRAIPTITLYSPVTGAAANWRNATAAADVAVVSVDVSVNGFTVAIAGVAAGDIIEGHWTADAKF